MRISCPYCGERALEEFTYRGDATVTRPTSLEPAAEQAWVDYVYLRDNPAGLHREHWHHSARLPCLARGDARRDHARDHGRRARRQGGLSMAPAQAHRTATGGLIDRTRTLSFTFDGEEMTGHPGDTLASALLANGVRLVGRSFKYHRPRGILSAGSEEPNALVELRSGARREPNTRATTIELYDGLDAASQNRWPSLKFDLLAVEPAVRADLRRRLLLQDLHVAGFVLGEALRAGHPPRRRARPRRRCRRPRSLREGIRLLRRAGHRRRRRRLGGRARRCAVRRAGDPVRGGFPPRRASARRALRDRRPPGNRVGDRRQDRARRPARLPHHAADLGVRRL